MSWRGARLLLPLLLALVAPVTRAQEPPPPDPVAAQDPSGPAKKPFRPWVGVSVGVGWDKVFTRSGSASNPLPFRFAFRTPLRQGWSIAPMFGWFTSDIDAASLASPRAELGELRVRPILMGARYTWIRGQVSWDVAGAAGVSVNSFDLADGAQPLLGLAGPVSADANVSPAWRLQFSSWYDFSERVALRGAIAYAWVEPEITFRSGATGRRITQSASSVQLGASVVYRLF